MSTYVNVFVFFQTRVFQTMESVGTYTNSCPVTDASSTGDHPHTIHVVDSQRYRTKNVKSHQRSGSFEQPNSQCQHMSIIFYQGLWKQRVVFSKITHSANSLG